MDLKLDLQNCVLVRVLDACRGLATAWPSQDMHCWVSQRMRVA